MKLFYEGKISDWIWNITLLWKREKFVACLLSTSPINSKELLHYLEISLWKQWATDRQMLYFQTKNKKPVNEIQFMIKCSIITKKHLYSKRKQWGQIQKCLILKQPKAKIANQPKFQKLDQFGFQYVIMISNLSHRCLIVSCIAWEFLFENIKIIEARLHKVI